MSFLLASTDNVDKIIGVHSYTVTPSTGSGDVIATSNIQNHGKGIYPFFDVYTRKPGNGAWTQPPLSLNGTHYTYGLSVYYDSEFNEYIIDGITGSATGVEVKIIEYVADSNKPIVSVTTAPQELDTLFSTGYTYSKIVETGSIAVGNGSPGSFETVSASHSLGRVPFVKAWIVEDAPDSDYVDPLNTGVRSSAACVRASSTTVSFKVIQTARASRVYYRIYDDE